MNELQDGLENRQQHPFRLFFCEAGLPEEIGLDPLQVPIAELPPDELIDGGGSVVETVFVKGRPHLIDHCAAATEDPAMHQGQVRQGMRHLPRRQRSLIEMHQGEASGIP